MKCIKYFIFNFFILIFSENEVKRKFNPIAIIFKLIEKNFINLPSMAMNLRMIQSFQIKSIKGPLAKQIKKELLEIWKNEDNMFQPPIEIEFDINEFFNELQINIKVTYLNQTQEEILFFKKSLKEHWKHDKTLYSSIAQKINEMANIAFNL